MTVRDVIFSTPSKIIHTVWFVTWFALRLDINLLTLIVSLEAIYLELFLGDGQGEIHAHLKKHLKGGENVRHQ